MGATRQPIRSHVSESTVLIWNVTQGPSSHCQHHPSIMKKDDDEKRLIEIEARLCEIVARSRKSNKVPREIERFGKKSARFSSPTSAHCFNQFHAVGTSPHHPSYCLVDNSEHCRLANLHRPRDPSAAELSRRSGGKVRLLQTPSPYLIPHDPGELYYSDPTSTTPHKGIRLGTGCLQYRDDQSTFRL